MLSGLKSLPTVLAQHQAIVDAIAADDRPRAFVAMQSHLRRILAFVGKARAAHPDFFETEEEPPRIGTTLGARGNETTRAHLVEPRRRALSQARAANDIQTTERLAGGVSSAQPEGDTLL